MGGERVCDTYHRLVCVNGSQILRISRNRKNLEAKNNNRVFIINTRAAPPPEAAFFNIKLLKPRDSKVLVALTSLASKADLKRACMATLTLDELQQVNERSLKYRKILRLVAIAV